MTVQYDDRDPIGGALYYDPIVEPGYCSNSAHSPRYNGAAWTCPDCTTETADDGPHAA